MNRSRCLLLAYMISSLSHCVVAYLNARHQSLDPSMRKPSLRRWMLRNHDFIRVVPLCTAVFLFVCLLFALCPVQFCLSTSSSMTSFVVREPSWYPLFHGWKVYEWNTCFFKGIRYIFIHDFCPLRPKLLQSVLTLHKSSFVTASYRVFESARTIIRASVPCLDYRFLSTL